MLSKINKSTLAKFTRLTTYMLLSIALFINLLPTIGSIPFLNDFGAFIAAGRGILSGKNPYSASSSLIIHGGSKKWGIYTNSPNLNPPISLFPFEYLAHYSNPLVIANIWRIVSFVLYIAILIILLRKNKEHISPLLVFWAFCVTGFWNTLEWAQIYMPLAMLCTIAWILLERRRNVSAGILLGLAIACKPNLIFWALLLAAAENLVTFFWSVSTAILVSLLPLIRYGINSYAQWYNAINHYTGLASAGNSSIAGLTVRFGAPFWLGSLVSVAFIAIAILLIRKNRGQLDTNEVNVLGVILSLLASPICWPGYTILLLPYFLSIQEWTWPTVLSALILAIPTRIMLALWENNSFNFIVFGWTYGWSLLILLALILYRLRLFNSQRVSS